MSITAGLRRYSEVNDEIKETLLSKNKAVVNDVNGQRYIGCALDTGKTVEIHGTAGNDLACYLNGGRIILYGVSMGGATVMQASEFELKNVVGIIEDCGYTSCWEEFRFVLKTVAHLPAFPILNVMNLLCKIFLKFDLKSSDSRKAVAKTSLPMLFVHGDADAFVPEDMSHECYEACQGKKQIIIFPKAAHAQSHFTHPERYESALLGFADECIRSAVEKEKETV